MDFPFEEKVKLEDISVYEQTIVAVDLGINTAATISVMRSDGTILGRHFYKLTKETDHLMHSINRIKKAQQHGNYKTPRLWAKAKGINHDIATKTAACIVDIAVLYNADVIVFEHLDKNGKVRCDLSASYNIGARYFIREILKSLDENSRLLIEAKVPQCSKRSTCTFSTLVNLNAEIIAQTA